MIRCLSFEEKPAGALVGIAHLYRDDVKEHLIDVKLWQKESRYWATLPSKCIDRDGKKEFIPSYRKDDAKDHRAFMEMIVNAIHAFRKNSGNQGNSSDDNRFEIPMF